MRVFDFFKRFIQLPADVEDVSESEQSKYLRTSAIPNRSEEAVSLIGQFIHERPRGSQNEVFNPHHYASGHAILGSDPTMQAILAVCAVQMMRQHLDSRQDNTYQHWSCAGSSTSGGSCIIAMTTGSIVTGRYNAVIADLMRLDPPIREQDYSVILHLLIQTTGGAVPTLWWRQEMPAESIVTAILRRYVPTALPEALRRSLIRLREAIGPDEYGIGFRSLCAIDAALGSPPRFPLLATDPWAKTALDYLLVTTGETRIAWSKLLFHSMSVSGARPTKKWRAEAALALKELGHNTFKLAVPDWLAQIPHTGREPMLGMNKAVLKGLVWYFAVLGDSSMSRIVGNTVISCYNVHRGWGLIAQAAGNAGIEVLGELGGSEPVAQLSRLRTRVKVRSAAAIFDKAMATAAASAGLSVHEFEEITVPTYGLDENGCHREEAGNCAAELQTDGVDVRLDWYGADGKRRKAAPAEVKREHPETLGDLKAMYAEIEMILPVQRNRIERFLLDDREWSIKIWRDRYINQPLLSSMCRRLIWRFTCGDLSAAAIWNSGEFVDSDNSPVSWLTHDRDDVTVSLWHPIGVPAQEVLQWRIWLESNGVAQPFKQAHREIYLLTDAEIETRTYSNRFAAHIIKQHQFNALCRQRGWKYAMQGFWDRQEACATLDIRGRDLRAEFWIDDPANPDDRSDAGIFSEVTTNQIRFYIHGTQIDLVDIPPLVFSEIMRDVDLFVGVTSVGNDPEWRDRGEGTYRAYFDHYSTAQLTESAKSRADVLGRLLPRLKIANKCLIEGRFLIIRGQLQTYQIHLGSGSIHMLGNNQYLCIVPDSANSEGPQAEKIFLPFEGDHTLAIILSKAFLLAEDANIKDETILRQIRRDE